MSRPADSETVRTTVDLRITGTVEALHLEPGDRVLVTLDDHRRISHAEIEGLQAQLKEKFPDHEVVVLGGLRLAVQT